MMRPRVLVAGGGPVGLALAAACRGFDVHVLEGSAAPAAAHDSSADFDVRIFALSPGSRALLEEIGAWPRLSRARMAAVRRMEVFGDDGSSLTFSPPAGEALAWILEASRLSSALEEAAAERPWVRLQRGAVAASFEAAAEGAAVTLESGERLEADLLVGADGPDSKVRNALEFPAEERPYGETALVANFDCEKPHGDVARQWFRTDGVLAWLPLPGQRMSIVWSAPRAVAEDLASLDAPAFAARVRDAGASALGDLRLISGIARFALRIIRVRDPVAAGVALVGDAAHAVHPLAGQGVNLGFQDARVLARILGERSALERPGDLRVLRRYARERREDVEAMQFVTDRLDQLFAARGSGIAGLRNFGLRAVNTQPWIKRALAARAMR